MTTNNSQLKAEDLRQFTGTTCYFKHFSGLRYTEGVQFMAERGAAYWLVDAIASYQRHHSVQTNQKLQEIQFWQLTVASDKSAVLTVREDSGEPAVIEQQIEFTDFPLSEISLYVCNDVCLLPSEY